LAEWSHKWHGIVMYKKTAQKGGGRFGDACGYSYGDFVIGDVYKLDPEEQGLNQTRFGSIYWLRINTTPNWMKNMKREHRLERHY
jgi:hypothetical protein